MAYNALDNRLLHQNGLMRMRLTPDEDKMIICTTQGYLMVIHDLDLSHFRQDLERFKVGKGDLPRAKIESRQFTGTGV